MGKDEKDNPGHITANLCEAYRETLQTEIKALRGTFITSISIATTVIGIIIVIMNCLTP